MTAGDNKLARRRIRPHARTNTKNRGAITRKMVKDMGDGTIWEGVCGCDGWNGEMAN
jgi:hypothetical protein